MKSVRLAVMPLIAFACTARAQHVPMPAPHKPVPPKVANYKSKMAITARSMVGGPWLTDPNYRSILYIRNDLQTNSLSITPILWLSNGVKYRLSPVLISAGGTATVDINNALQQQGIAGWAMLTGYVELQYQWRWDAICATIENIDAVHSELFNFGFGPAASASSQSGVVPQTQLEGLWWKQEPNVTGFVSLSNTSGNPIQSSLQTTNAVGAAIEEQAITIPAHETKLVRLLSGNGYGGSVTGGISLEYAGAPNELLVEGGLEDPQTGYSAGIPFVAAGWDRIRR
jgi:hypothetical protein